MGQFYCLIVLGHRSSKLAARAVFFPAGLNIANAQCSLASPVPRGQR